MTFELTILGSSSALPTSSKFTTAQVLNVHERFFLIDCGEGTQIQLRRAGFRFSKIDHIFISHLHGDHVFGLFGLLSTFSLQGRKKTLHIFGPIDLKKIIDFYQLQFSHEKTFPIELHLIQKRTLHLIFEDKQINIFAFPLKHRISTFGYLFKEKDKLKNIKKPAINEFKLSLRDIWQIKQGNDFIAENGQIIPNEQLTEEPVHLRSFAFCSDTSIYERIIPWIEKVDLLYHESTFMHTDKKLAKATGHSTALQAATIAQKAMVKKLIIGHFSSRYKNSELLLNEAKSAFSETYLANELNKFSISI